MNIESELVSIVLPTFNGERFLRQSIESCLNQSYSNIELIVVDDCSTDSTSEIIKFYERIDKRVKAITNERNLNLPASLNRGFEHANGTYLSWTSDDNHYGPNAISTLVKNLKTTNADIAYSSYYFIDEAGKRLDKYGGIPEELLFSCSPGASFLYKKIVHEKLKGYDASKFRMEDMDFWLRAAAYFKFSYMDSPETYFYRKHPGSLSSAIYSDENVYQQYRKDHGSSFKTLLNESLFAELSDYEIELHLELYFEDIVKNKNWGFDITPKLIEYIDYLDKIKDLNWSKISFNPDKTNEVIRKKRDRIVSLVVNDLIFDNAFLKDKNPQLAKHLNKPISWYYKEYEVLPLWYKRIGHLIKYLQGNKSTKSKSA